LWKKYNQTSQHSSQKQITAPGSYAPVSAQAITPKSFKEALGKFNEHFAGNEQHDAQELLAFILGGLSEDLNCIVEKPYIEAPDSDGRPDRELADIWWSNHLKREMSIIVALFTGQYKSLLTCRSCKYESARFEPFSFLQLPMPEDDQISVSLVYYTIGNEPIMKYSVRVRHDGTLSDVVSALARVLYVDQKGGPQLMGEKKPNDNSGSNDDEKGVANDDDIDDELEEYIQDKVQNMAIVDMREGYILKIAPVRN
jgi:Ubiquitin carboxyl-terminal hydrolase